MPTLLQRPGRMETTGCSGSPVQSDTRTAALEFCYAITAETTILNGPTQDHLLDSNATI